MSFYRKYEGGGIDKLLGAVSYLNKFRQPEAYFGNTETDEPRENRLILKPIPSV